MNRQLSRRAHMVEKVVFVDGLSGSGKSLLSNIVSNMERVELLSFLYEVESYCILHDLNKLSMDVAKAMIRLQTDLKLYNTMMGRDVNFRPTDVSSVFKNPNPNRYFQRLFEPGDESIPEIIRSKKPILNICTHNLFGYSEPLWEALQDRCVFINVVRHPVYMVHQQSVQMQVSDARNLAIHYEYKGRDLPYFAHQWEERYLASNAFERAIYYTEAMHSRDKTHGENIRKGYGDQIVTIPFESFVLSPESWVEKISKALGVNITSDIYKSMSNQNVPRSKVSAGLSTELYKRYGWIPPKDGVSESDELSIRRKDIASNIDERALDVLDRLSGEYENNFWRP